MSLLSIGVVVLRTPAALLALLVPAALLLAACGGDDPPPENEPTVGEAATIATTWPLTGLEATGDEDVAKPYPVLVTKIDNTEASSPQAGLGGADLVVEELVEGGLTRLAVFFYSDLPERVGPVRSMRASDIGIVAPAGAAVVTSGAAGQTIARIQKAGITFYQEGAKGISRDSSRPAPYNVFADLTVIAKTAEQDPARPDDYLPWGDPADLPKGKRATTVSASFSGGHTTDWAFQNGTYANVNTNAAPDDQFAADTVLVLRVQVGDAGYLDPAGNPVPETQFEGKGVAMLFHNGRMVRGTWSKGALDAPLTLSTRTGELGVPPGHTWIELVPAASGSVTFK
jgi:hypothetical protein